MKSVTTTSRILAAQPPSAAQQHLFFAARLSHETDPSDVWHDVENGVPGFRIIDPRSPEAFADEHIPGALSLPHDSIDKSTVAALESDLVYVVYGWGPGCNAGTKAASKLSQQGVRVKEILGGIEYWKREGLPTEKTLE